MGIFGISLGSKKSSGSGTSSIDKTTDLTGSQQSTSTQQGTTNTSTTNQGMTSTSQQGATNQTQDSTTRGQTTGRTTGTTTTLGQDVQDALSSKVQQILAGGITDANIAQLSNMISGRSGFDSDSFVSGIVDNARNRGEQTLQESNSAFAARAGGTANTNSMAALLAARGRNDLESNLAAIQSQAQAQAEQIQNQNLSTAVQAQSGVAGLAQGLADTLKGGTTSVDMTQLSDEIQQLIGKTGGISSQTGTEATSQTQDSTTNQLLTQIANILTQQTQKETGTEVQTQKGKNGGFGISLGL
jgi:hypothetical protein